MGNPAVERTGVRWCLKSKRADWPEACSALAGGAVCTTSARSGWPASFFGIAAVAGILFFTYCLLAANATAASVIVVVGAAGEEAYGKDFIEAADAWAAAARRAGAACRVIGRDGTGTNDLAEFHAALDGEAKDSLEELWIVFAGHGTFDGKEAKFNLRGPDLASAELARWLDAFHRPIAVLNCASASAPFIKPLSLTNRVVVTGTRSGAEENYARFGRYLAAAIADPAADLDKDGQTSLLEAFLMASRRVAEFYQAEGRLATEHALLDDNGDGLGTPADWFRGIRAINTPAKGGAIDGLRAHQWHLVRSDADTKLTPEQRARRGGLELEIAKLRGEKARLAEEEYYRRLEKLMLQLGEVILGPARGGKK